MNESFFIFLHKPIGVSSQAVLTQFKKIFHPKKIGHHGTLDPFADGLLLAGINEATKYFPYVWDERKTYRATLVLGKETDSLDHTGKVVRELPVPQFTNKQVDDVLQSFLGKSLQTPPMYSSVKQQGQRLYDLAREGLVVERKARPITVYDIATLGVEENKIIFEVTVSRGTYIRVLASDVAIKLGTVGCLVALTRTHLCGHDLSKAFLLDGGAALAEKLISIPDLLSHMPKQIFSSEQSEALMQGKSFAMDSCKSQTSKPADQLFLGFCEKRFIGVVRLANGFFVAERMMSLFLR